VLVIAETRRLSAEERRQHVSIQMTSPRPLTSRHQRHGSNNTTPPPPPSAADQRSQTTVYLYISCLKFVCRQRAFLCRQGAVPGRTDWRPRVGAAVRQTARGPAAHTTVGFTPKQATAAEP